MLREELSAANLVHKLFSLSGASSSSSKSLLTGRAPPAEISVRACSSAGCRSRCHRANTVHQRTCACCARTLQGRECTARCNVSNPRVDTSSRGIRNYSAASKPNPMNHGRPEQIQAEHHHVRASTRYRYSQKPERACRVRVRRARRCGGLVRYSLFEESCSKRIAWSYRR